MSNPYNQAFYEKFTDRVMLAASVAVPEIIKLLQPRSVVDVGCGIGEWLAEFSRLGVVDILGIDGNQVEIAQLRIPESKFLRHDLTNPLSLERRFDLALSLEVAEHLPSSTAESFVLLLTQLAPAIVFSAAIPGQGGVHHINEQWHWYWHDLFARRDYVYLDVLRSLLWRANGVPAYYQQNMFLYVDAKLHADLIEQSSKPDRLNEMTLIRTITLRQWVDISHQSALSLIKTAVKKLLGIK